LTSFSQSGRSVTTGAACRLTNLIEVRLYLVHIYT
jgi:hypothetical protein